MIRIEITETLFASPGPVLVGTVLLDDKLELTCEAAKPDVSFDWLTEELSFPNIETGQRITFDSDPIRWARLLPAMLRNPQLMAQIIEDTFEPKNPFPAAVRVPAVVKESIPFGEQLRLAVAAGHLDASVLDAAVEAGVLEEQAKTS